MKFTELAKRIEPYFDKALILDVQGQLPQGSDYSIWGWDVGDFSGDGYFDLAISVKSASEKKRITQVYMFVDISGYLTKVGQYSYTYVDMSLEIGIVIKKDVCYVTRKNKQFDWLIIGYTFDNGSMIKLDEYSTSRVNNLTYESYRNYKTLKNTDKYLQTNSGKEEFFADYLRIPCYPRSRLIYKGYSSWAVSDNVDYINKGAYDWKGKKDCSFEVSSAYDDQFLYMTVSIDDESIVTQSCDTCPGDFIDVWFDIYNSGSMVNRFIQKNDNNKLDFRKKADSGLFCFSV
jgi:hypothetical protein